jgi:predicted phosphodiesterase
MAKFHQEGRLAWVEGPGELIVISDLHGNFRDFLRIVNLFESRPDSCLLLLGDLFHGPFLSEQDWAPHVDKLGDFYYDQSPAIFRAYLELTRRYPDRVRAILGNHEHAHIGGPRVAKFTPDEAGTFEGCLTITERVKLSQNISQWPWIVGSDCGVTFTHGSPPPTHFDLERLNSESPVVTNPQTWAQPGAALLSELLWRRFSPIEDVHAFLSSLNAICTGASWDKARQRVVTYGHEPSPNGYQVQHEALFNLSSSFAMKRRKKTYLSLSLGDIYQDAFELREQIMPLYTDYQSSVEDFDDTIDDTEE